MDPSGSRRYIASAKKLNEDLLNRAFDRVVGSQIEKLTKKDQVSESEHHDYKKKMEVEREKASKRKRDYATDDHVERARTTGLSVEVIALMDKQCRNEDDLADIESMHIEKIKKSKTKKYSSSDDSSRSSEEKKKLKRKKHKKSKKSSQRKRSR